MCAQNIHLMPKTFIEALITINEEINVLSYQLRLVSTSLRNLLVQRRLISLAVVPGKKIILGMLTSRVPSSRDKLDQAAGKSFLTLSYSLHDYTVHVKLHGFTLVAFRRVGKVGHLYLLDTVTKTVFGLIVH